jgi:HKD family nuclease
MGTMNTFITNAVDRKLKDRLLELIHNSQELKFLVGFFYFSGIKELYDGIQKQHGVQIDVLVGLNVDAGLHGLLEYAEDQTELTEKERFERFLESVSSSINSDDFDTAEFYQQIRYFTSLIETDKLRIRKTFRPNHAKLYIFKMRQELQSLKKSVFLTGSSNLTKAGLSSQDEFNVEISDYGTEKAEAYFDELWTDADKITEHAEFKQKLITLIQQRTLVTEVTPFEAFALVLKTYIDALRHKKAPSMRELLIKKGYQPYAYQLDALAQALAVIESYNGVIISDVVGLGKSIIAGMIAKSLGKRGIIICPPGLIGGSDKKSGWQKYKEDFELHDWEIRSIGLDTLENTLELVKEIEDFEVIIVDEVHRFRNQDTRAYDLLAKICKDKTVILLTATPFNNSPADIFSLLKLFVVPGKSKITLDNDLDAKFRVYEKTFEKLSFIKKNYQSADKQKRDKVASYYESLFGDSSVDIANVKQRSRYLSNNIRAVIEPVLIRRNRIDLKKDPLYSKEIANLPIVKDPQEVFFVLTKEQSSFYDEVINDYFGEEGRFTGAIYRPFVYEFGLKVDKITGEEANFEYRSQTNLYDFMRRLIVKRFESSFGAFEQSVRNFRGITLKVQKFIKKSDGKFILDRKLVEKIYESDIEEIEESLKTYSEQMDDGDFPKSYRVYDIGKFKERQKFLDDIQSDIDLFTEILTQLEKLTP